MTECPREYKNHGVEAFGEGRYVTAEMLKQFCKNDSYLKNETESLWLEVNPTSRKRLDPLPVDPNLSYGVTIPTENDKVSRLSDSTFQSITLDFNDLSLIDAKASTAIIDSRQDDSGNILKKITIPRKPGVLKKDTRDYSPWATPVAPDNPDKGFVDYSDLLCNEYWYISYRKDIPYELRTTWLKNPLHGSIPGVSRAQTFKAKDTGILEAVTLNIKGPFNVGTPLIVCIHNTVDQDGILYPKSNHDWSEGNPFLARQDVFFENTDPGIYTVTFEHPCNVEKDKSYAIAVYSPTTHPSEAYSIGGWSQSCLSQPYKDGYAFVSENSGATWSRYGKVDETVPYHYGNQAPQDFAFICHIRQDENNEFVKDKEHYLYLKPIRCNPCKSLHITSLATGEVEGGRTCECEVSSDGKEWAKIKNSTYTFSNQPTMLFVRIVLKTDDVNKAPYVTGFGLALTTEVPMTGYARLPYYCPPKSSMLGANVWGELYAPYILGANETLTSCSVELISNRTVNEHHKIIDPLSIRDYTNLPELERYREDIEELKEPDEAIKYLTTHSEIVGILKKYHIHIIKFIGDIQLDNRAAYPMTSVTISTKDEYKKDTVKQYNEFYEYKVNYTESSLRFMDDVSLNAGELNIQYNPLIISDLKKSDLPFRLDYVQEEFIIGEDTRNKPEFMLKCAPNDPIYEVLLNNEYELKEDVDFNIDYLRNKLILKGLDEKNILIYKVGDRIKITYTPHITDEGLSIGFSMKRKDSSFNIEAGLDEKGRSTYLEYKS